MGKRHGWRVRGAVVVLAVIGAALASVTMPERAVDPCPGGDEVATIDDVTLCTHGSDAGPLADPGPAPAESGASPAIACIGNGTSGARVQAVYARLSGRADRFAALQPALQAAAADVSHLVNRSAAQTAGERHVRWVTSTRATVSGCTLTITRVTVPAASATNFGALVDSLVDQGLDRHDRKYLVWIDSPTTGCSGVATYLNDDRPGQENFNNTSVGYGRVDESCLSGDGMAETHELMHTLGAVQHSAPHASPEGHCTDEWDLVCYDEDGAGSFTTSIRCPTTANNRRLDCHNDDYFSTAPVPGTYLATHWNSADSRYLDGEAPVVVPGPVVSPPPNDAFAGAPVLSGYSGTTPGSLAGATLEAGEPNHGGTVVGSTWYKWRPRVDGPVSVDTRGSAADTVLDVYTGSEIAGLVRVGANDDALDLAPQSRVTFDAVAGTTYRIAVSGRGGAVATTLRWGPPPHGFVDVLPGARSETAVGWAAATGVMTGRSDRTWRPRDTVTRGQAVATLWRLVGAPDPASSASAALPFRDVGPAAPYREALTWAVGAGVVPAGAAFQPPAPGMRADLAAWTWAALGRPTATATPTFADVAPTAPFAGAATWAAAHHLTESYADGTFRPTTQVTRAKLAIGLFALAGDPSAWASYPGGDPPDTVVF